MEVLTFDRAEHQVTGWPCTGLWLERNPQITLHFTPTSGSWLRMVGMFFGIITR